MHFFFFEILLVEITSLECFFDFFFFSLWSENERINPYYECLFEQGVDEMSWDDLNKNDEIWPTISEVHEYRKTIYEEKLYFLYLIFQRDVMKGA